MKNTKKTLLFALALSLATLALFAQAATPPADIVGLGFVGHQVADLERSIKYFEAIDFKLVEGPSKWEVDKELNQLGNTPNAESRTATMQVQSSVSDVPFRLILRQYRGIDRQDWSTLNSFDLGANHIDLTVDNVSNLLDKLEGMGLLKMPKIQGLANDRQQKGAPGAFRSYSFISDPDGLTIENFGVPAPRPGAPPAVRVSNSTATGQTIDRWGKQTGFNHYAVNVVDPEKARDFYIKVLGGDYPAIESTTAAQLMQNGWYPQATTKNSLRIELVWFALNKDKTAPPMKFQDINANFSGFQVKNIETAYARAKANGASTVTSGGIMKYKGGRAVMIRDSDVGGYIMLWEPGK